MSDEDIPHHYLRVKHDPTIPGSFDLGNIDRFGVLHPDGIPDTSNVKVNEKRLWRRIEKWREMTSSSTWCQHFHDGTPSETLLRRTFKGVPPQYRSIVWPSFLDVELAKRQHPNVYLTMLRQALANSLDIHQIDMDISRAFRNTTYFHDRFGPRQVALFKILVAYSAYNTEIGYCQGMSDVVAMLLIYIVDDEDAFWTFAQLMASPRHLLQNVFKVGFPGLCRLCTQHELILQQFLPSVAKHFIRYQVETTTYAIKWFMQCFLNRLPLSLVLRLWDIYLLRGECIPLAMAYNLLKMHRKRILSKDNSGILTFLLNGLSEDFMYDDEKTIQSLQTCLNRLEHHNMARPPPLSPEDDQQLPRPRLEGNVTPESVSVTVSPTFSSSVESGSEMSARRTLKQPRPPSLSSEFEDRRQANNNNTSSMSPNNSNIDNSNIDNSNKTNSSTSYLPTRPGLLTSAAVVTMSAMSRQGLANSQQDLANSRQGSVNSRYGSTNRGHTGPRPVQPKPSRDQSSNFCAPDSQWLRQAVADEINRPIILNRLTRIMDHPIFPVSPAQSEVMVPSMDRPHQRVRSHPRRQQYQTGPVESAQQNPGNHPGFTVISIRQQQSNTVDALNPREHPVSMRWSSVRDRPPTNLRRSVYSHSDDNLIKSQFVPPVSGTAGDSGNQFVRPPLPNRETAAKLQPLPPTTGSTASRGHQVAAYPTRATKVHRF